VPGKDYKEYFSPVASDTSIRIGFCIYLTYDNVVAEMIDITVAFLEGIMRVPIFVEGSNGMQDLGFASQDDIDNYCIQLLQLMYGNVDAAIIHFLQNLQETINRKNADETVIGRSMGVL
jgi:hypothetical protein